MHDPWWIVLWFGASLALLVLVNRWFGRHLWSVAYLLSGHEQVAHFVQFAVLLPGVLLHELSHWATARLLGLYAGRMELWPRPTEGGLQLGSVQVQQADPFRNSLVGLAPLLSGSLALFLIGRQVFGLEELLLAAEGQSWQGVVGLLLSVRLAPDFWLWAYLIFAVANAMLPSQADRYAWGWVAGYGLALLAFYWLLVGAPPTLPDWVWELATGVLARLAAAFNLALVVDGVFGLALLGAEAALLRLRRAHG